MLYQIKSTPFFQRMLSTSKKNGQLQKLKEEYDRIREINEGTIDMRPVHLKRLFCDIDEIKESSSMVATKRRRMTQHILKTKEESRLEAIGKAKEAKLQLDLTQQEQCARIEYQQVQPQQKQPHQLQQLSQRLELGIENSKDL